MFLTPLLSLLLFVTASQEPRSPLMAPDLRVKVCTESSLTYWSLHAMLAEAERVLRPTDIHFAWELNSDALACAPSAATRPGLAVRLLSRAPATVRPGVLATAVWVGFSRTAYLYCDRAARLQTPAMLFTTLGRALAHEITHLLLPSDDSHSAAGLMRAIWSTEDLAFGASGRFRLEERDISAMRVEAWRLASGPSIEHAQVAQHTSHLLR